MQRVVNIVVPLRVVGLCFALLCTPKVARLVEFVFQDKVDLAARLDCTANFFGEFGQKMGGGIVNDCVNRVQPESVEMIFRQPVEGVVDKKVADGSTLRAVEVDGVAPRRSMPIGKK